jgi:thymidylate synthase ThyX
MMSISSLKHIVRPLKNGGQVIVVDDGAILNAEALAMIQAMKSRSVGGFFEHMKTLVKLGAKKFMEKFYMGYGHKSIGDCGDATVIVEGVSMLVPKAVQDWPLYNGQESSTRYIDFSKQTFLNPLGTVEGEKIQENWRKAYLHGLAWLKEVSLWERFPKNEGENEETYRKAINARAFDIMRSFLPAGATTDLTWHMNLRQFADELLWLRHHPLEEVREVAEATEDALMEMYPSSFSKKRYADTEQYIEEMMREYYFDGDLKADFAFFDNVSRRLLPRYRKAMESRPNSKTELPKKIKECGNLTFEFFLDFGSFRDIQRHRAVVEQMPLLSTEYGFHPWYFSELGEELRKEMKSFVAEQTVLINNLPTTKEIKQYYTGMGFNTTNRVTGDLHALVYLVELRGTRFVHPTLLQRALQMASVLRIQFGDDGLVLHLDPEPNRFDVRRGTHDIVMKS